MKNYSQAIKDALTADMPRTELLEMQLAGGTVRLTTADHDIEYLGNTYIASGLILGVSDIKQQQELRVNSLEVEFTAVDQTIVALFLNTNQQNRRAILTQVVLDQRHQVVGALISSRYIVDSVTVDDDEKQATIAVNFTNFLSDFEAVRGIRTTQASFQRFYPNSSAFINSKDIGDELKWGGK
jgi:hypothetical protein